MTQHKITVKGPHHETENPSIHREALLTQLKDIPKNASNLSITEDTPSDTEWDILAAHFTAVRELEMFTGWNEDLNDKRTPTHWPIEKMQLADACGEVIKSPHILQGRIKHLILNHTCGLGFEGAAAAHPAPESENQPIGKQTSQLRTLEIIENDALDTFLRMYASLSHVVDGITSLTLRSTEIPDDLDCASDEIFLQSLSKLTGLQTLNLFIGEIFKEPTTLPSLCKNLPPNLTTLQFRGPLSFGRSNEFEEWVGAFSSDSFLPKLERLAIVLDYHYSKADNAWFLNLDTPPEAELAEARAACERLYEAARQRGITVQPLHDRWVNGHMRLRDVDSRW
ncbi:uncharacterized protein BDV14DRAFT_9526 [Aspergillus stella-maris]|uniref:uncharacterized protein n=1 Tax=Aspergillus stella-maris TaxID=1810926 RepID=UPI003CCD66BC